jgi:hypothetical protein
MPHELPGGQRAVHVDQRLCVEGKVRCGAHSTVAAIDYLSG